MKDFWSPKEGKLDMNPKWTSTADVAKKGGGNVAHPKAETSVGATGDNAANNGGGNGGAFPGATSKVGATGDSVPKRGK